MTTGNGPANSQGAPAAVPSRGSPAPDPAAAGRALRTLSPAGCFGLLELGGIGRVGFAAAAGIMMLPVNFAVTGKAIIFPTAPDTLLAVIRWCPRHDFPGTPPGPTAGRQAVSADTGG